ncbi:hypothetical protein THAOC_36765 [Thalassiosira oceanica]|uniref:Uncharacterized protein n=1 Tax=Thalassiosira oceanica TaxID=159749 RepID=K0R1D3_THAOC|nr:hypothetical protein THAOC_36765 [Thalassiosira oceanica]|eukprot:EJK44679.1 hypothetical protein THAOC_36765 [Thalassiosira oceanica]
MSGADVRTRTSAQKPKAYPAAGRWGREGRSFDKSLYLADVVEQLSSSPQSASSRLRYTRNRSKRPSQQEVPPERRRAQMASESTSPEDDHGHADGTASRTFAPSGVSAQVTGGGTNAGDRTATPLLQEVPRNGATASTIRAIPDDDDPPIPVWQVADHEKEWKGPQLHDGPAGPQPFFSHEFDDSLAKRGGTT